MTPGVFVPEIVPAGVPVVARPSPFSFERREFSVVEGTTLSQILEQAIAQPWLRSWAAVAVDGLLISPWQLPFWRTAPGERVTITVIPRGGGGEGGSSKNTWAVVLSIVVILAATIATVGWGTVPAATIGGATITVGQVAAIGSIAALLAINALLPPPRPKLRELAGGTRTSPSIAGTRNEIRPFGVVPRVFGRVRYLPPLEAA